MADGWQFGIGNVMERIGADPAAGTGTESTLYPFSKWGDRHADEPGGWDHETAGVYTATFDLSMLETATDRADAPTGWADLLNLLAGTPGLPANPPDRGTYASRSDVMRVFWPSYQDVVVMPGETIELDFALYLDGGSTATAARLRVQDLATGLFWDGTTNAWTNTRVVASTAAASWSDVTEEITANANRLEPTVYRIILEPVAASYGSGSYIYVDDPAAYPEIDTVALIGHNIPLGSTIAFGAWSFAAAEKLAPIARHIDSTPVTTRDWTLSITVPDGLAPAPLIGEVWVGAMRDFTSCPLLEVEVWHDDPAQIRTEGGGGRQDGWSNAASSLRTLRLQFKAPAAGYQQHRDEVYLGTRRGVDPILILGDNLEANMALYGRVEERIRFKRVGPTRKEYTQIINEEPLWAGERGVNTAAAVP